MVEAGLVLIAIGILLTVLGNFTLAAWDQYRRESGDAQPSPRDGGKRREERGD